MKGVFGLSYNYNSGRGEDVKPEYGLPLAIATVPMQKWRMTYTPEKALKAGTMFAELNLPFMGGMCK